MLIQRLLVGVILLLVVAGVGLAVVLSFPGSSSMTAAEIRSVFRGVEQKGAALGSPRSPLVVSVYSDVQCPACKRFDHEVLPGIVRQYVRSGQVQLILVPVAFKGGESKLGGQASYAAGEQGKMWQMNSFLLMDQKAPESGYINSSSIRKASVQAGALPGRVLSQTPLQAQRFARGEVQARQAGVQATPSFGIARRGEIAKLFVPSDPRGEGLRSRIDSLLR